MQKKKTWAKRAAALLLCAAMIVTTFPVEALAADEVPVQSEALVDGQQEGVNVVPGGGESTPTDEAGQTTQIEEGQPGEGQPAGGQPAEGQPTEGQPAEGQPTEGQPAEGQPTEGQPAEGQPTEGQITAGQPAEGQPAEGQPQEGQPGEAVTAPETPVRGPADWTNRRDAFGLALSKITYQETGKETVIVKNNNLIYDLSAMTPEALESLQLEYTFDWLNAVAGEKLQAGDRFSFTVPAEVFTLENTSQPIEIKTCDKQKYFADDASAYEGGIVIGTYTVAENVVTATYNENVQALAGTEVFGMMSFRAVLKKEALNAENTTAVDLVTQKDEAQAETKVSVVLPKLAPVQEKTDKEEVKDDNAKEEAATGENTQTEEVTDGDVKDETGKEEVGKAEDAKEEDSKDEGKKEESFGQRVRGLFKSLGSFFTGESKTAPDNYYDGATITEKTISGSDLPEGFSIVKITAASKKDGYTNTATDQQYVGMAYSVFLDEDYLYAKSEELMSASSFPQQGSMTDEAWYTAIGEWAGKQDASVVPPLVYTYNLGEKFGNCNHEKTELSSKNDDKLKIGSYEIVNGVLTVTMNPILYFMQGISFEFNFDAELDKAMLTDKPQEIVLGDKGELVFQSEGTTGGGSGTPDAPKYSLKKEAPIRVTDTEIAYKLTVNASEGEYLNGMTLKDDIDELLQVKSLTIKKNKETESTDITVAGKGEKGVSYQFEKLDEENPHKNGITSAEFELVVELTDEAYAETLVKTGKINQTFTNQASLLEAGKTDPAVVSNETSTNMNITFINKKGKSQNLEGTRYAWTISLDTRLPNMEYGYLVDSLRSTDHDYDFATGIMIIPEGGETVTIKEVQEITGNTPWSELTADNLKALESTAAGAKAFWYVYDDVDAEGRKIDNPFYTKGGTEPEYVQRKVLVIPYLGYQGTEKSKSVTVKYFTDLNMHGLDRKTYTDKIQAAGYGLSVDNSVNLLWKNKDGKGPEPADQDEVHFGKDVDTNIDTVKKTGVRYNPETKMAEWVIDVNKLGIPLQNVVLTDTLKGGAYDTSKLAIQYYKYNTGSQILIKQDELPLLTGTPEGNSFGYTKETAESGDETLTIYLGNIGNDGAAYDYYKLSLALPLTDLTLLAHQSTEQVTNNTVKLTAKIAGENYNSASTGQITVPNTLIEKEAVGTYNYQTHELSWAVTVNPEKVKIQGAKVTDTMESGFGFGTLQKVEVNGVEDTEKLETLKNQTVTGQEAVWTLGDIDTNTYKLYFTTKASNEWRNKNLKCETDENGALKDPVSVAIPNEVKLEGTVVSEDEATSETITNAAASASNVIEKKPLTKKGELDKKTGEISWVVNLNEGQYNLQGMYLQEELNKGGEVIHELDVDSIEVYKITADGAEESVIVPDDAFKDAEGNSKISANGFSYYFSSKSDDYNTYRIKFKTYLTKAAEAASAAISNQVYLKDSKGSEAETSKPDNGGFDGGFDFENAANASPRPKIALRKISSNSSDPNGGGASLGLDAEFALKGYGFTYDATEKTLTVNADDPISKYDKERKVAAGDASFLNINPNDAIVYVLSEISPKGGYDAATADPVFLYFPKETSKINGEVTTVKFGKKEYTKGYQKIESSSGQPPKTVTVTNTPAETVFTFAKKQIKASEYSDKEGVADSKYEAATNVVFKIEPQGDLEDKVKTQYVTTDKTSGEATIKNLDPGSYLLTEVKSNANMSIGGTVKLKVKWETDKYTYTFSDATGGIAIGSSTETGTPVLQDDLLRGSFSFKKYVKYVDGTDNAVPAGSENQETLSGVSFEIKGTTAGATDENYSATVKSDASGEVTFRDLPVGTYAVYENVPNGYAAIDDKKIYTVVVTEKEDKGSSLGQDGETTYHDKKAEVEVTQVRAGNDSELQINNTAIKGTISFTKKLQETTLTSINDTNILGAEFGLFRKIGDTVAKTACYTVTSGLDGKVTFSNVEYGDYVLKETKVPAGYVATLPTAGVTITKGDLISTTEEATENLTTFTYTYTQTDQTAGTVVNQLYKTNVPFIKQDVDHNPLTGIKFDIYRRGDKAVTEEGENFQAVVGEDVTSYYKYGPEKQVTTDEDGKITLENLPYGEYLLIEQYPEGELQAEHAKEAVHVSVTNESVTITENQNFDVTQSGTDDDAHYDNVSTTDWPELTNKQGGSTLIVNQKKYAYINMNKQTAERVYAKDTTSSLVTDDGRSLAGARFEITQNGKHYLTLETNASGQFAAPATTGAQAGAYKDLADKDGETYKHLFYGTYTITESNPPAGFKANTSTHEFTVDGGADHEGTVWISLNDNTMTAAMVKKGGAAPTNSLAANELLRGTFSLNKVNEKKDLQPGATFVIYAGTTAVASLADIGGGSYQLSNKKPGETAVYEEKKENGDPYIYGNAVQYGLLPGTYTVKETKAPAGYKITEFTLTITEKDDKSGVAISVDGNDKAKLDEATGIVTLENAPIALSIEKQNASGDKLDDKSLAFSVTGTFVDTNVETAESMGDANAAGFIAGESYTLKETTAPAGYILDETKVEFTVQADGTVKITAPTTGSPAQVDSTKTKIIFKDDPIIIKVLKQNKEKEPLVGVKFSLTDVTDPDNKVDLPDQTTIEGGVIELNAILTGGHTYQLQETDAGIEYVVIQDPIQFSVGVDGKLVEESSPNMNPKDLTELIIENEKVNAAVTLQKLDAESFEPLNGVTFTLTRRKTGEETEDTVVAGKRTEGEDENKGKVSFTELPKGVYTLTETATDVNYDMTEAFAVTFTVGDACQDQILQINNTQTGDETPFDLTLASGEWNETGVLNTRQKGSVSLVKKGDINGTQSLLSGAEFALYRTDGTEGTPVTDQDGNPVILTTGKDGSFTYKELSWGDYYLQEVTAPDGYQLDESKLTFTIGYGKLSKAFSKTVDGVEVDGGGDIVNQATELTIEKKAVDGEDVIPGAAFTITGKFVNGTEENEERSYDMTKAGSMTIWKELLTGETYTLTETIAPQGYELAAPITFTVEKNGDIKIGEKTQGNHTITVEDQPIEVDLIKQSSKTDEDGDAIVLTGGSYQVSPAEGYTFVDKSTAAISIDNQKGNMKEKLSGKLIVDSRYILHEITAPEGYELAGDVTFTVDKDGKVTITEGADNAEVLQTAAEDAVVPKIVLKDKPVEVTVNKLDEKGALKDGAEFTVTPATGSHFAKLNGETEELTEIVIKNNDDKNVLYARLIAGQTYTIKEMQTPEGYIRFAGDISITVGTDGTLTLGDDTDSAVALDDTKTVVSITNQPTKFFLNKVGKEPDEDNIYKLGGATLEIQKPDGSSLTPKKDWTSDDTTMGEITNLPAGAYQLAETKTPEGYLTADSIPFELKDDNSIVVAEELKDKLTVDEETGYTTITMTDIRIRGHVELTKELITKTPLAGRKIPLDGAKFALWRKAAESGKLDTLVAKDLITNDKGILTTKDNETLREDKEPKEALSKGLEAGSYYLVETEAPANAVLDSTHQEFTISAKNHGEADEAIAKVSMTNEEFAAAITLTKLDNHEGEHIAGTVFTLSYKAPGETAYKVLDATITTDGNGQATVKDLKKGDYFLTETTNVSYDPDKFLHCTFTIGDKNADQTYEINSAGNAKEAIGLKETDENMTLLEKNVALTDEGIENTRLPGSVTILKLDGDQTDKQLKDTKFKLMKQDETEGFKDWFTELFTGKKYEVVGEEISGEDLKETEGGKLTIANLEWGTYKLVETKAVDGYKNAAKERTFEIKQGYLDYTAETDGGTILNFQNNLTIEKQSAGNTPQPLPGAEFTITEKGGKDSIQTAEPIITGADGTITLTGELVGGTTYVLHEITAPDGYILPDESADITFTMEEDGTVKQGEKELLSPVITVTDQPIEVKLVKTDSADTAAFLAGAEFTLVDQTEGTTPAPDPITVISKGNAVTLPNLIQNHTYKLTEEKAPAGYILPAVKPEVTFKVETTGKVTFTESTAITGTGIDTITVADDTVKTKLEKVSADPDGEGAEEGQALPGWEFEVAGIFTQGGGVADEAASTIKVSEAAPNALDGHLIAGNEYKITETKEPEGYIKLTEVITVQVNADGTLTQVLAEGAKSAAELTDGSTTVRITNQPTKFFLNKITNEPEESGNDKLAGAVLEIKDEKGQSLKPKREWKSNGTDMKAITNLPKGSYVLEETTTPTGYFTAEAIKFELKEDNSITLAEGSTGTVVKGADGNDIITMTDKFVRGDVEIVKHKKVMEGCADGTLENVPEADYTLPVGGAEFTLYSDAQASQPVTAADGSPVTAVSQTDGTARFEQLPMGTYYMKETKAPEGCLTAGESIYKAVINAAGKYEGLTLADGTALEGNIVINDVFRTDISLKKVSEQNPDKTLPDSTYGLYKKTTEVPQVQKAQKAQKKAARRAMDSAKAASENTIDGWTLISTSTTDEDGMLLFKGVLMGAEYMIRELIAPDGSQVSEKPITVTYETDPVTGEVTITSLDMGDGTAELDPDTGEIVWKEPSIMLGLLKKDAKGQPLAGAALELQDMEGNVLVSFTSTDSSYIVYGDQMEGKLKANEQYQLVEKKAPKGYVLAEPVVFTVEEKLTGPGEEFIQAVEMTDEETVFGVNKIAEDTKSALKGAKLAVYEAGTQGAKAAEWTTDGSVKTLTGLGAGNYVLREEAAPDGYDKAEDIAFTLQEDGKITVDGKEVKDNVLTMTDAKTKTVPKKPEKPEDPKKENPKKDPKKPTKTGDTTNYYVWLLAALLSGGILIKGGKKKFKK